MPSGWTQGLSLQEILRMGVLSTGGYPSGARWRHCSVHFSANMYSRGLCSWQTPRNGRGCPTWSSATHVKSRFISQTSDTHFRGVPSTLRWMPTPSGSSRTLACGTSLCCAAMWKQPGPAALQDLHMQRMLWDSVMVLKLHLLN